MKGTQSESRLGSWKDPGEGPGGVYSWFGEGSRIYRCQGRAWSDLQCGHWAWVLGDEPGVLGSGCQVLVEGLGSTER